MMILKWLWRLLFGPRKDDPRVRPRAWPTREQIEALPPFEALELKDIIEVVTPAGAQRAYRELENEKVLGFDTESKPTFVKGHVSTGPHVAQFSTKERAYVFILHEREIRRVVGALIALPSIKKVGFGLGDDLRRIRIKLGVEPQSVVDLETIFAKKRLGRGVGVKVGVALTLKRRFMKSKKASTSNWMSRHLTDKQILYAANDAYAAIRVFAALGSPD